MTNVFPPCSPIHPALCTTSRLPASREAPVPIRKWLARPLRASSGTQRCPSASASASERRKPLVRLRPTPMVPWSVRRWSMHFAAALIPTTGRPPRPSKPSLTLLRHWQAAFRTPRHWLVKRQFRKPPCRPSSGRPYRIRTPFGAENELAHQRRPAEDSQHAPSRNAGEFVDQVPRLRPARLLQGRRGQSVRHSRFELSHAHGRDRAAEVDLRQRDLVRRGVARGAS